MAENSILPIVDADWLATNIGRPGVKLIDVRPLADYSSGHIPGSLSLNIENLRGNVGGIPSMLLPAPILAGHFSLMGLKPTDAVIMIYGERPMDASLVTMALERLGHANYAILDGGFAAWKKQNGALTTTLPQVAPSRYPAPPASADQFTADAEAMNAARLVQRHPGRAPP
jgi:thiosulfate/3-mercaptopyruvate sulfurtransferase